VKGLSMEDSAAMALPTTPLASPKIVPALRPYAEAYQICGDNRGYSLLEPDLLLLIGRICERFRNCGEPVEDLFGVARFALTKQIRKYDPVENGNLTGFAVPVIVGAIKNYFKHRGWAVKVPQRFHAQKSAVEWALEDLALALERAPSIPEIAEATGFSQEEIMQTLETRL